MNILALNQQMVGIQIQSIIMSGVEQDNRRAFKSIVIGKSGVGKSTLLVQFLENKFVNQSPTLMADYQCKDVEFKSEKFKLELWDTAGQERFRKMVMNYFSLSHAACIVFDLTDEDSLNDAKYWLEQLSQRCGLEIPKLLLGNKCDMLTPADLNQTLEQFDERIKKIQSDYNCEFFVVSGRTGENVQKAFNRLTEMVYEHYIKKKGGEKRIGSKLHEMGKEEEPGKRKCC